MKQKLFWSIILFSGLLITAAFAQTDENENLPIPAAPVFEENTSQTNGEQTPYPVSSPNEYVDPNAQAMASPTGPKSTFLDVLDLKDMDILDVLKIIAKRTGLNIVASQDVKGRVTIYLKNIEVLDALKILVQAYDWAYIKDGDIIKIVSAKSFEDQYGTKFGVTFETRIIPLVNATVADVQTLLTQVKSNSGKIIADAKSNSLVLIDTPSKLDEMEKIIEKIDVPLKTEVFSLSYAVAEEVSNKITETLTPGMGRMKFDARSNRLVVSDIPRKIEEIRSMINAFDEKDKQVNIEAKIVQITLSDAFKMGVDWEAIVENYQNLDLKSNFTVLKDTDKRGQLSIGTLSSDKYHAVVEALDTVGTIDILSSPHIASINNKEAKILVGSQEPYVTTTTTTPATGAATTAETVSFIDVGVKLFVTPTIHEDGFISIKIKPEVSSVVDRLQTSNNNLIPIVGSTQAETTVTVKDNVTIVIGGLMEEKREKTRQQVPVLGSIPVLGAAFRNISDTVTKREIVVFLTPKIMTGDVAQNIE
jgi:type II secretory pathway component GspD/PulD (secretin)